MTQATSEESTTSLGSVSRSVWNSAIRFWDRRRRRERARRGRSLIDLGREVL